MNIPLILSKAFLGRTWFFDGNDFGDYNRLYMLDGLPKPTLEEIKNQENNVTNIIAAELAVKQEIVDTITTNLPTWSQVEIAIDNISNLSDAKVFLGKLSKVVYQHIKGTTNGS